MRGPDENSPGRDPRLFENAAADLDDLRFTDQKRVESHESNDFGPVVKNSGAGLAGIVKGLVVAFSISARTLHPDRGRNVALGESGLHRRGVKRVESRA